LETSNNLLRTPLYSWNVDHGARIVPFAGWEMPVQFEGLSEEHHAVRKSAGLFDVSHMGEIRVRGDKSLETLQWLTTNDVSKLQENQAQYSLLPNPQGGIVDDIIVYCLKPGEDYLLCVNAANKDKDFAFLKEHNRGATIEDESSSWGQIAVQGPGAPKILESAFPGLSWESVPSFNFRAVSFEGQKLIVAKTGYTGEPGGEIFVPWDLTLKLWTHLMEVGAPFSLKPCGLGARDTLRLEMKYPLYGNELSDETNPYAAGLGWVVKPKVKDFLGKEPMLQQKETGNLPALVGLMLEDKGVARSGYQVFSFDNEEIGRVTSGTVSPTLQKAIAVAYVAKPFGVVDSLVAVDIRGRKVRARVVPTPFVQK
jgi:aminomethyltransferase